MGSVQDRVSREEGVLHRLLIRITEALVVPAVDMVPLVRMVSQEAAVQESAQAAWQEMRWR